jgi:hypothetical protein
MKHMKPGMTNGTFYNKPQANPKNVGNQGTGGETAGSAVSGVSNPKGIEPKKIGGGRMPLSQGPRAENVGRK